MPALNSTRFDLQPIRNATDLEWAWAAGVFEGEGSIHFNGSDKYLQLRVAQKDPFILKKLQQFCGGRVRAQKRTGGFKPGEVIHSLDLNGAMAKRFLRHTHKWLSPRRQDQLVRVVCIEDC